MGRIVVAALLMLGLGACSAIPADPDDTLERVSGDTLRAGVAPNPPWTHLPEGWTGTPAGTEVDLVTEFAASLDAEVDWIPGSEQELFGALARNELDLVVAGLHADSPWQEQAALTRPYIESTGHGDVTEHVMAVPAGENAFLVEFETFLLEQD